MLQVADLFLLLIDGASQVLIFIVLFIKCTLQVIEFRLLHREELVVVFGHDVPLSSNFI
jgi:hypothetical protein